MATLVTGGTGFVGAEVVRCLLNQGEQPIVVFDINPETHRLGDAAARVEIVRGDLGTFSHVLDVVRRTQPRVIYHLGGMLSASSDADPAAALRINALGTFHVLEAARLFGVPQVLFSSTIGTYGQDIHGDVIGDDTLQRPFLFYGATKVFCEHMGLFYRRKYGLDFRAVRYPSVVGPGVRTSGVAQYTSWVIEEAANKRPFTIWVTPETRLPIIYFKDAARAMVQLGAAAAQQVTRANYVIAGATPPASAGELAEIVRKKVPGAQVSFAPNPEWQALLERIALPLDDRNARQEWDWTASYDQERIVDDFLVELREYPQRYVA